MYLQSNPLPNNLGVTSTVLPTQVRPGIEVSLYASNCVADRFGRIQPGIHPTSIALKPLLPHQPFLIVACRPSMTWTSSTMFLLDKL